MKIISKFFEYIIIFWSLQIIFAWILSFFQIYNVKLVLIFTIFLCALFLCSVYKKISQISLILKNLETKFYSLSKISRILLITTLTIWVSFALYTFVFIFLSPAVNWDSLTYHLTKAAIANQTGSWWYHSDVSVARVNIFSSNASILDGVAFSLLGKDYLVELPQMISSILIPTALFYIGVEIFKKRKLHAFIATLSVLSIPLYLYESKTTQNDLVFTTILLISIISLYHFSKEFNLKNFIILILSSSILIGTKYHGLIATGIIGLFALYLIIKNRKSIKKKDVFLSVAITPLLVFLAFPSNIIGLMHYNSFIALDSGDSRKLIIGLETIWNNIKHFSEWFYFRPIGDPNYFSFDVGHAGFLNMLTIPAYIFLNFKILIKRNFGEIIFFCIITGLTSLLFSVRSPDSWDLRLILFLPVCAAYIAVLYLIKMNNKFLKLLSIFFLFLSSLINILITFYFVDLPIIKYSLESLRSSQGPMSIGDYYDSRYMTNIKDFEDELNNRSKKILIFGQNDTPLYPYYGEAWQNKVTYLKFHEINNSELSMRQWDYLVVYHNSDPSLLNDINKLNLDYNILTTDYYVNIYTNEYNNN